MSQPLKKSTEQFYREKLEVTIGTRPYNMWLAHTKITIESSNVVIEAQTQLNLDWIKKNYSSPIENVTKTMYGKEVLITYTINPEQKQVVSRQTPASNATTAQLKKVAKNQLLSFTNFIVGTCNQLAYAASKQITDVSGHAISPLFIHGGNGVGKTHLLQAICKHTARTTSSKVRYVTAEQFTNEYIQSSRFGEFDRFRNRYRHLDLLAIDDVHFVKNKIKTQEELLHTLDAAGLRGARLVLASDEEPRLIKKLNNALANRFVAGLVVEITQPDRETRLHIIELLTRKLQMELTPGAVNRLASQTVGSVRELKGLITTLHATTSLLLNNMNDCVGSEIVEKVLRSTPLHSANIKFKHILEATSVKSGISAHELRGKSRTANIVFWRSLTSYLGRELTNLSFPELASAMGRNNHSTVIAACKKISVRLAQEDTTMKVKNEVFELKELIDQLKWAIRSLANKST
ncbi:MAG TPA: chromosomal replication initiator protein DnaA [Phycisphaerales bacterium]|nr:chromosomal replication initiator protein DnaA [Phycisphaerales bacterium]